VAAQVDPPSFGLQIGAVVVVWNLKIDLHDRVSRRKTSANFPGSAGGFG